MVNLSLPELLEESRQPSKTTKAKAMRIERPVVAMSIVLAVYAGAAVAAAPPVQFDSLNNDDFLQLGNANDAYWVSKNPWGANGVSEGPAPDQWEEHLGVYGPVGSNGEVAFRLSWRWPLGVNEVKGYPAILSGRKPGFFSSDNLVDGRPIRLLDGSLSQRAPTGDTPGTFMPEQLPIPALTAKLARSHLSPPTGQGQLTFDIWLQSAPGQDHGFGNSSITHEIMIPLENWGSYGAYPDHRNPQWYDHDATIGGRLFHVYCTKGADGGLRYDFGSLNGNYGRTGWKMIAFVPDVPIGDGELDLAAFINYIATRRDVFGEPWGLGNEYLASVELGVEPVEGTGDLVIYDYKVSPTAPSATVPPYRIQAEDAAISGTGVSVNTDVPGYDGSGFVGPFSDPGDRISASFTSVAAGSYDINIRYHTGDAGQVNTVIVNGASRSESFPATGIGWAVRTIPGIPLAAGTNVVSVVKDWGWTPIDYVEIVPAAPRTSSSTPTHIQAEDGTLSGSGVTVNTDLPGYEGTGFVGPFSAAGDQLSVSFANVAAGTYDVNIRYSSSGAQQNDVVVNGVPRSESFAATGSGWAIKTVTGVSLGAGTNVVAIAKDWGWISVDSVEIVPGGAVPSAIQLQAETGAVSGTGVSVKTDLAGYEGSGFVGSFSDPGDTLRLTFPGVVAGTYNLTIRYHAWGDQQNSVVIDGTPGDQFFPATGSAWTTMTIPGVTLPGGTNTVDIVKEWGFIDVDWIEIVP